MSEETERWRDGGTEGRKDEEGEREREMERQGYGEWAHLSL